MIDAANKILANMLIQEILPLCKREGINISEIPHELFIIYTLLRRQSKYSKKELLEFMSSWIKENIKDKEVC